MKNNDTPSLPEPSADPIHAILNRRCHGKSVHPEMVSLRARAESAEAQLAVLRERVVTAMHVCSMRVPPDVNAWWAETLGPLLTPASSPGAGEKT